MNVLPFVFVWYFVSTQSSTRISNVASGRHRMLNQCHKTTDTTTDATHVSCILELAGATSGSRIVAGCLNWLENDDCFK